MAVWTIGDGDPNTGSDIWWGDLGIATGIAFDPLKLYRITVENVRVVSGGGKVYLGWMGYDIMNERNGASGSTAHNSQYYHAASRSVPIAATTFVGYTKGYGSPNGSSEIGTLVSPSAVHVDTAFIRPFMLVNNITGGIGVTEVGTITIDEVDASNVVIANIATYTPADTIYWAHATGGWVMPQNDRASSTVIVGESSHQLPSHMIGDTVSVPITMKVGGLSISPAVPFTLDDITIYRGFEQSEKKATTNGMTLPATFGSIDGMQILKIDTSNETGEIADFWTDRVYLIVAKNDEAVQDGEPGIAIWTLKLDTPIWDKLTNDHDVDGSFGKKIGLLDPAGNGEHSVDITVEFESVAVPGARIRMALGAETYFATTDASGVASLWLTGGDWTVGIFKTAHDFTPVTLSISANTVQSYTIVGITLPSAPTADQTVGFFHVLDGHGDPVADVIVKFLLQSPPDGTGNSFQPNTVTGTSDVNGLVSINLVKGARYSFSGNQVDIPADAAGSHALPNVVLD